MPEMVDRASAEQKLEVAVAAVMDQYRDQYMRGELISWEQFARDVKLEIQDEMTLVFRAAFNAMQTEFKFTLSSLAIIALAESWASRYTSELSSELARTTANVVQSAELEAIELATSGDIDAAEDVLDSAVNRAFGKPRAQDVAITEAPRANSAGEAVAKEVARQGANMELVAIWKTERDMKVCPICEPLHNKKESVWRDRFPLGPPAHPR